MTTQRILHYKVEIRPPVSRNPSAPKSEVDMVHFNTVIIVMGRSQKFCWSNLISSLLEADVDTCQCLLSSFLLLYVFVILFLCSPLTRDCERFCGRGLTKRRLATRAVFHCSECVYLIDSRQLMLYLNLFFIYVSYLLISCTKLQSNHFNDNSCIVKCECCMILMNGSTNVEIQFLDDCCS